MVIVQNLGFCFRKSPSISEYDVSGRYQEDGDKDRDNDKDYDKEKDYGDIQNMYHVNTPPCVRQRRRQKDKHPKSKQYTKEYKDYLARKKKQPRTVVNVIREDYGDNPSFCKVSGTDSDDNLEREIMKEKKERRKKENRDSKKFTTKSRGHERYVKRLSDDYADSAQSQVPHLVPVSNRVSSQNTNSNANPKPVTPVVPTHNKLERTVTIPIECPKERSEFYRLFSTLINLGSMNKKDKDRQMVSYKRQMSCEQEMLKNDLLWLQLQAWYNNDFSREQHQQLLEEQRQHVPAVLDAILNFKLHCLSHPSASTAGEDDAFADDHKDASELNSEKATDCGDDCGRLSPGFSTSFRSLTLTSVIVACQREALLKVQQLLDRLDKCERLYPHSKAFAMSNEVYGSEEFSLRVKSLCLWLNITRDLCHKMKLLGRVLGVHNIVGLDWPMSDYESPRVSESRFTSRSSIPNILEKSDSSEEDNEMENESPKCSQGNELFKTNKQVTFSLVSPSSDSERASPVASNVVNSAYSSPPLDTSTPNKYLQPGNAGSFTSSLSRDSSVVSLEELDKTSVHVYRHFVDKSLRKMGMHRLVIRLRDLLDRSLQRAKEALQKPSASGTYAEAVQQVRFK